MTSEHSKDAARKLREAATLIETHDLASLANYPDQIGRVTIFVETETDLLAAAKRLGVEAHLPADEWDHGRAYAGSLTITWIPERHQETVRRLREENEALKKLVKEVKA